MGSSLRGRQFPGVAESPIKPYKRHFTVQGYRGGKGATVTLYGLIDESVFLSPAGIVCAMLMHVGENIKKLRVTRGFSIRELAAKSGVSISQISKIETGKVDTTAMNLMRLAAALGVPPSRIVDRSRDEARPMRKGEGYQIRRQATPNPQVSEIFLHIEKNAQMQPELLILPPGADSGRALAHDGDEFCYVLEGTVRCFLGAAEHILNDGDLIYFDNRIPHRWQNEDTDHVCKLLLCCAPPVLR